MPRGAGSRARRKLLDICHPSAQLRRVYHRYQGICQICFEPCSVEDASREHIIRLADGGSNKDYNVVLAHAKCNQAADPGIELSKFHNYTTQSPGYDDKLESSELAEENHEHD